jgi:hypothetical protein
METQVSTPTAPRVRKEVQKSPLAVSRVYTANYQKEGTLTAEVKQIIETKSFYPSKSVSNNLKDNPFGTSEFDFKEQEYVSQETRVAWIPVPAGSTAESVQAKISSLKDACIYRILGNKPILSNDQVYAIEQGLTTQAIIADSQVVRYPVGHEMAGKLITDANGKPQYKATFYKNVATADQDMRTEDASDFFATPTIAAELGLVQTSHTVAQEVL